MLFNIVIILLFLIIDCYSFKVAPKLYSCNNNGYCDLINNDSKNSNNVYASQLSCLMVCGKGILWPYPTGEIIIKESISAINIINIIVNSSNEIFDKMYNSFLSEITKKINHTNDESNDDGNRVIFNVDINNNDIKQITLDVNESYSLSIKDNDSVITISITAETVFGARHALETVSQLITIDNGRLVIASDVVINNDQPRFPYRGVMLDVSRHFLPLTDIKRTITAMGYNKLNVLHLHLSDTASFPLALHRQPNITYYGAYSAEETYTLEQLSELASFANIAGVMILPEFDGPAHTGAGFQWGSSAGIGDLVICDDPSGDRGAAWVASSLEPPSGQLNLANPNIYDVITGIYEDLADSIGSSVSYIHVGGDEIIVGSDSSAPSCFNNSIKAPQIIDLIEELGLDRTNPDTFYQLWDNYTYRIVDIISAAFSTSKEEVQSTIKKLHIWGGGGDDATGCTYNLMTREDVTEVLPPELYTIQIWDTMATSITPDLLKKGYDIVLSNTDYVYLDCGNAGFTNPGGYWCQPYHEWQHIYNYISDAESSWGIDITGEESRGRVIGSETLLWAEMIDSTNLDQKMWPRTAALAEVLWGVPAKGTSRDSAWYLADPRMQQWRETLVNRGVNAEALQPRWCSQRAAYSCTIDVGTPQ